MSNRQIKGNFEEAELVTKKSIFIAIMMLLLLLSMGNSPGPNAFCMGKAPGDKCTMTGLGCYAASGICQHDETTGFHDDPNTPEDEALLCITEVANLESPFEPTKP